MDYLDVLNSSGFFFVMGYSFFHFYIIVEYFYSNNIKKDYIELEKTNLLKSKEIERLKIYNEKLILELKNIKNEKKESEPELEKEEKTDNEIENNFGSGKLRYKILGETDVYYHGIGHLEKKYAWWSPNKNHCIIECNNVKYPDWETNNIKEFCNNCIKSDKLNKRTRNKTYYICNGHKL